MFIASDQIIHFSGLGSDVQRNPGIVAQCVLQPNSEQQNLLTQHLYDQLHHHSVAYQDASRRHNLLLLDHVENQLAMH